MVVRGALCYEDLRSHEGTTYATFREACQARGLIGDDAEWSYLFEEAIVWATPSQLRNMFMTVVLFCDVGDVRLLFQKYWKYLADDISRNMRQSSHLHSYVVPDNLLQMQLLQQLSTLFIRDGSSLESYNLPVLPDASHIALNNRLIIEELDYDS